ncbi:MAG: adenylosuccinate synthetase [Chloroflexota bacterium]
MSVTIVAGGFWGDEGKGKVVAYLAIQDNPSHVVRAGVGPNAGHTIHFQGRKWVLRQVPSGFVNAQSRLLIGAGVLLDPRVVQQEVSELGLSGRLGIDGQCTVIEEEHIQQDRSSEHLAKKVGTTGTGCGPANEARVRRQARLARDLPELKPYLADVPLELHRTLKAGHHVLIEGTQGFGLSLYHGSYPFVTSKDTTASAFCMDVGIGPTRVNQVIVVFKAYVSRVGEGPLSMPLSPEEVRVRGWEEFGAVTGRPRRIGEFDLELARRAVMINGATQVAVTCLDKRFPECYGTTRREQLSPAAEGFLAKIEGELELPVTMISTGPELAQMIDRR